MGDYTKHGEKIGTCGRAYYATRAALLEIASDPTAAYYLDPKNECAFAFPFPEYDGKAVGDISNFHKGQRAEYFFSLPAGILRHGEIVTHIHPDGAHGVNVFAPCPYESNKGKPNDFGTGQTFRLIEEKYKEGKLLPVAECVYCEQRQTLNKAGLKFAIVDFERQAKELKEKAEFERLKGYDEASFRKLEKRAENIERVANYLRALVS